ncbi:MAG TPA: nuclear transport factor 2 family protein [Dehalococcoidia bacterium]
MVQTAAQVEQEVQAADAERVRALLANDIAALEALLGDDLAYVHSNGMLDTKASYIDSLRSGVSRYLTMDMSDVSVRALGEDIAAINAKFNARVQVRGGEVNPKPRVLIVYARRNGRWQMVAWQSTPIANP